MICIALHLAALPLGPASAGHEIFHLFAPPIEKGHWGLEFNSAFQDGFPAHDEDEDEHGHADIRAAHELGVHVDVSDYWMTKIALEMQREADDAYALSGVASENVFRFSKWTPRTFDAAWFTAVAAGTESEATNAVEFGPIVSIRSGPVMVLLNPFFEKTFGRNREEGTAFTYGWRLTYSFSGRLSVGLEGYGEIENLGDAPAIDEQVHRVGSVLYLGPLHGTGHSEHGDHAHGMEHDHEQHAEPEWFGEVGLLFGLTDSTPDTAVKLNAGVHF